MPFKRSIGVLPAPLATGLGWLVALGFATSLFASGATLLIAVSRTYAIAALDRAAPLRLGRFSRTFGTPIAATILSGMVASVTVVASILLAAFGSESIGALFVQVLGVAISTALLAYLLMFPTFLILRYRYPSSASQVSGARRTGGSLDRDALADGCMWALPAISC